MATPNFPTPPGRRYEGDLTFPSDLTASGREFYTSLGFVNYEFSQATGRAAISVSEDNIKLPMPRKINDVETILWEEFNGLDAGARGIGNLAGAVFPNLSLRGQSFRGQAITSAAVAGAQALGLYEGLALNPFMFMMFRRPGFKEYTFHWTLAANNQRDSDNLKKIITACKKAALPQGFAGEGFLMKYPKIATIKFKPDNYLFKIKPCAILSVAVDYTGANGPSFFKNGAPTVVNLSIAFKEMQLRDSQTAE